MSETLTRSTSIRVVSLFLAFILSMAAENSGASGGGDSSDSTTRPAVGAANLRFMAGYAFSHFDDAKSTFRPTPSTTATLRIEDADRHATSLEIVGTIPVMKRVGLRGRVRGGYQNRTPDVDLFGVGSTSATLGSYGAAVDLFIRDPGLGALTIGGSFDRLDGEKNFESNNSGARAETSIFFPDFGSGPVDWTLRFDYSHQDVDGQSDATHSYRVAAEAGWYLTQNSKLVLGGRWSRIENEFFDEEDAEGFMKIRWLLPTPIPMEFSLGGSAGVSEYEESPYPKTDRLIYGGVAEWVIRFRSGSSLIEMVRGYD